MILKQTPDCRHLEQHGLRTVGIFRVSASKKRVRQVGNKANKAKV
jgi:hypothetical protein